MKKKKKKVIEGTHQTMPPGNIKTNQVTIAPDLSGLQLAHEP